MNELVILSNVGSLPVTAYALCLAFGALLGVLATACLGRRRIGLDASLSLCLAVIPCALIGARLFYVLTNFQYIQIDLGYPVVSFLLRLWEGGYTLYGAVLGGMAGAWLYGRFTRRPLSMLLDLIAPGAALALALTRLGEAFTGQGLGKIVDTEALRFFPVAVPDLWGDWCLPVFFYEAVAALVVAIIYLKKVLLNVL